MADSDYRTVLKEFREKLILLLRILAGLFKHYSTQGGSQERREEVPYIVVPVPNVLRTSKRFVAIHFDLRAEF